MKASRKRSSTSPAERAVPFIVAPRAVTPGVELHKGKVIQTVTHSVRELKNNWNEMMQSVTVILADTEKYTRESGFQLDEIAIGLGFNANGKLAFIAEAGVEASVSITFKRA